MKRNRHAAADHPTSDAPHIPVMLAEVLAALEPKAGETYVDATFGAGGYSKAILDAANCRVIGLDRDPSAIARAARLIAHYADRLDVIQSRFGAMREALEDHPPPDGIVFDLGVSSMQLDEPERGFSFQLDGPLDMRMGHADGTLSEGAGPSAADLVNTTDEAALADIIFQLGEEKRSRAIARAIVARRATQAFSRTSDLAQLIANVPGTRRPDGKHAATRTFQALRMWVNDELGELARGLAAAEQLLAHGGRLVVVTFHSLEDRIVKRFLAERCGRTAHASRHLPHAGPTEPPSFHFVNSKSLSPGKEELASNPRSRSARLRTAVRTEAPAFELDLSALGLPEVCSRD